MASWIPPTTHATSDILPVTDWNALCGDATFLLQAPYALAYNAVSTSIGTSYTQVTLVSSFSNYGFTITSNNLVVPISGIYAVTGQVGMPIVSGNSVGIMAIYQQGGTIATYQAAYPMYFYQSATIAQCNAGDTLALYAVVGAGSSQNTYTGVALTFLSAYFIGSQ
jgi:hypothetical protein